MSDPELHVSGGAGGIEAHYEDIEVLARHSGEFAERLAAIDAECHAALVDPNVLASAVLDPKGVARFEGAMFAALDGHAGLTALSVGLAERSVALRAVVTAYRAVDDAERRAIEGLRWTVGYLFSSSLPGSAGVLAALGAPIALYTLAGGEIDWQRLITDHPGIVDDVVGAGPGLISGLPLMPLVWDVPSAAHLLGLLYPDGRPHVDDRGVDTSDPTMTVPPGGFADLLGGLDYRNGQSDAGKPDQIDVRVITHPDGTRAYVVDIPGTKEWDAPGKFSPYLNDLGTNVHVLGGDVTAREQAIADALRRAGASPTDPVMLVGHSQGGMVAAQAAHDTATGAFNYHVTHVVTAGSPIGTTEIPSNVQVLSLENQHDIVPHLDGADDPDRPNRTTVTFDTQRGTIGDNHSTHLAYLPAAHALDHSSDPSVVAYRNSASTFLPGSGRGSTVEAHVYDLTRVR
ncbi:MAG TPA: alpha/beta hydrolase [Micromonosporaceae bacterium]